MVENTDRTGLDGMRNERYSLNTDPGEAARLAALVSAVYDFLATRVSGVDYSPLASGGAATEIEVDRDGEVAEVDLPDSA